MFKKNIMFLVKYPLKIHIHGTEGHYKKIYVTGPECPYKNTPFMSQLSLKKFFKKYIYRGPIHVYNPYSPWKYPLKNLLSLALKLLNNIIILYYIILLYYYKNSGS